MLPEFVKDVVLSMFILFWERTQVGTLTVDLNQNALKQITQSDKI